MRFFNHIIRPNTLLIYGVLQIVRKSSVHSTNIMTTLQESKLALESVGYRFNEKGQLRSIDDDQPYKFEVKPDDKSYNQAAYENLGKIVDQYIFNLLSDQEGLLRVKIPLNHEKEEPTSFIFHSPNLSSYEKLLVLIHGSGVVRAGQWSRRLIINHSLESGTQLPYIQTAKELGYGVLVMNSNLNRDSSGQIIRGSERPEAHFNYVWENFVKPSKIEQVAIIAHSYGGVITVNGAAKIKDVAERTFAVAFTDSVHSIQGQLDNKQYKRLSSWIKNNMKNWVSSHEPLNSVEYTKHFECPRVSAGTPVHEETSWKAFDAVWDFIGEMADLKGKLESNVKPKPKEKQSKIADFFKKKQTQENVPNDEVAVHKQGQANATDSLDDVVDDDDVHMESQKEEL